MVVSKCYTRKIIMLRVDIRNKEISLDKTTCNGLNIYSCFYFSLSFISGY